MLGHLEAIKSKADLAQQGRSDARRVAVGHQVQWAGLAIQRLLGHSQALRFPPTHTEQNGSPWGISLQSSVISCVIKLAPGSSKIP